MTLQEPLAPSPAVSLPNYFAANLRVLRKEKGWSQSELARRVGLNRGNIASYESGSAEPNICKTLRVSKLFGVAARDLIRYDFRNQTLLLRARHTYQLKEGRRQDRIAELRLQTEELRELIASSRSLYDNKRDKLSRPCPDATQLAAHYETLYQVTEQLLETQQELLAEIGCGC